MHLTGERELILDRMGGREHFMPAALLDSQLDTQEPLEPDEHGVVVDIGPPLDEVVEKLVEKLRERLSR